MWIIECIHKDKDTNDTLFWSNEWGWITDDIPSISLFTSEEKDRLNLPIDGIWVLASKYNIE